MAEHSIFPGAKFGKLTAVAFAGRNKRWQAKWECRCECGNTSFPLATNLFAGTSKSCGKCTPRKHGESRRGKNSPEYVAWLAMKARCTSKQKYARRCYLDRGITVCERWANSFEDFLFDVGRMPTPGLTLDRIENDLGYEPGNVRWATRGEQSINRRTTRMVTIGNETRCISEWSRLSGIPLPTLAVRVRRGWPEGELLSKVRWKHRVGRCASSA